MSENCERVFRIMIFGNLTLTLATGMKLTVGLVRARVSCVYVCVRARASVGVQYALLRILFHVVLALRSIEASWESGQSDSDGRSVPSIQSSYMTIWG